MRRLSLSLVVVSMACGGQAEPATPAPVEDAGREVEVELPPATLAEVVSIKEVAFFQATKVSLVRDGAKVAPNAPVVSGKQSLLRVYVAVDPRWKSHDLTVELKLQLAGESLPSRIVTQTIATTSTDGDEGSTFDFEIDAASVTPGLTYSFTVDERTPREAGMIRYPATGFESVGAKNGTEQIRLRFVPVRYAVAGAASTLPDTSEDALTIYRDQLLAWYPTAKVEIDVREPMDWSTPINADGTGWEDYLNAITELRAADAPASDIYYIGAFKPAVSFGKYCGMGCVLGLSPLAGAGSVSLRASSIIAYGRSSANTLAHELAHAMGRAHAPCGDPAGVDRKYPYESGSIGVWGWDFRDKSFVSPDDFTDFMTYCQPNWISDYTFKGLFDRITTVNATIVPATPPAGGSGFKMMRLGRVAADGSVKWGKSMRTTVEGAGRDVVFRDLHGASFPATAHFYPYDTIPGGMILVEESAPRGSSMTFVAP